MELKVNDYVRYRKLDFSNKNNIKIAKIIDIQEESGYNDKNGENIRFLFFNDGNGEYEDRVTKSSPNIIDLIEIGDYVNGYEVTSKDQFLGFGNHDWYMTNDEIKTIVTKEQMEQMSYKVGD